MRRLSGEVLRWAGDVGTGMPDPEDDEERGLAFLGEVLQDITGIRVSRFRQGICRRFASLVEGPTKKLE